MKNIIIYISLFTITACLFKFEQHPKSTIFYNYCSYDIEIHVERSSSSETFTLKKEKDIFFNGINNENEPFYLVNNIKKYFYLSPKSSEYHKLYIACPENTKPTGDGNWIKAN
ncbi:hypothetical protein HYE54_10205 [Aggregatibacter actinomycetemcomitans]|uniref:hypothetical protein n=1 Tax=Aggregatibacter actinomycetemcomitans TaxID=714 RepID=UPI00197C8040|nr:hypothetical protein [Aggregatibacter actinomycetemcomitans]MBN6069085.1 hypothetical protein [Aggregatibacter actinomycetemcomitans]MBN6086206.1 hypothetical protein [Aggregatibacter actinomycetemcomitans]